MEPNEILVNLQRQGLRVSDFTIQRQQWAFNIFFLIVYEIRKNCLENCRIISFISSILMIKFANTKKLLFTCKLDRK